MQFPGDGRVMQLVAGWRWLRSQDFMLEAFTQTMDSERAAPMRMPKIMSPNFKTASLGVGGDRSRPLLDGGITELRKRPEGLADRGRLAVPVVRDLPEGQQVRYRLLVPDRPVDLEVQWGRSDPGVR